MTSEISFVLGTRPEIIKLSPVIRASQDAGIEFDIIHTGQHYSDSLDSVFFEQLELPEPDYNLEVGSGSHGQQTGAMIAGIEEILLEREPSVVLVQGDTNSVLAGAIATSKLDIDLGHVEAGLRSFNREMPEETNRILTDHAADYLFAPTEQSAAYLRDEGISQERIVVTGNTVVDAVKQNRKLARKKSSILSELDLTVGEFALMTAHRPENVDEKARFAGILNGVRRVAKQFDLDIVYPIHPRARQGLEEFDLDIPERVRIIDPADYLDFLTLEAEAEVIITDSGGVQEEACIIGVPCVTVRDSTERPETVDVGANLIVGTEPKNILDGVSEMYHVSTDWENPFGNGTAGEQIVKTVSPALTVETQI